MKSRLDELLQVTKKLNDLLSAPIDSKNREKIIDKTSQLIEKRESYIAKMEPPFTEEEIKIGKQIVDMNIFILKQMEQVFSDLKIEMKQVKQKKQSNRRYSNPYRSLQAIDGSFMDKKK